MEPTLYGDPGVAAATGAAGLGMGMMIFYLVLLVVIVVSHWIIFKKAGQPGWASIIPFYNAYKMVKIADKPGWWFILLFVPIVNVIISIIVLHGISKAFGKGVGYTLGLLFLGIIFWPMLAFGKAQYHGGADAAPQEPAPTPEPTPGQTPSA